MKTYNFVSQDLPWLGLCKEHKMNIAKPFMCRHISAAQITPLLARKICSRHVFRATFISPRYHICALWHGIKFLCFSINQVAFFFVKTNIRYSITALHFFMKNRIYEKLSCTQKLQYIMVWIVGIINVTSENPKPLFPR